jgi:hypothetical protein
LPAEGRQISTKVSRVGNRGSKHVFEIVQVGVSHFSLRPIVFRPEMIAWAGKVGKR